jgi:hypothetical protein
VRPSPRVSGEGSAGVENALAVVREGRADQDREACPECLGAAVVGEN